MIKIFPTLKELKEHIEEQLTTHDVEKHFLSYDDLISYERIEEQPCDYIEHYRIIVRAGVLKHTPALFLIVVKEIFNEENAYTFYKMGRI